MESARTYNYSTVEFERIRALVLSLMGISLSEAKQDLVYGRLCKRLRHLQFDEFSQYCDLLEKGNTPEIEHFTNAITTNLTSFFREAHHFEFLTKTLLPELMKSKKISKHLRVWSAGCSTGEEPYSLAMTLLESRIQRPEWNARILATDIDSNVLATAKAGTYDIERISNLDKKLNRWVEKGTGVNAGKIQMVPQLQDLITFKQLNLMHSWPFKGPFDFIFCRNVVIYFNKETQKVLFDRFAEMLPVGGHLLIGHSESLYKVTDRFELIGKSIYQRTK